NTRHLDRIDLSKTILMSESSTNPGIFRKNHKKMFFCGSLFPLGIFIEKYGGSKKRLGAGGSVATTAWDFCRLISSGHLFCGGLDLGFPENKTHFHGSFFEERFHTLTSRITPPEDYTYKAIISGNPFSKGNNTGTYTLTDSRLSIYIQWFEEQIKINKISNIWNISPLGIKIEGMDYMDIKKLLNYPDIRDEIDNIRKKIATISTDTVKQTKKTLIQGTNILKDELERLSTLSNKGILLILEYKGGEQGGISVSKLLKGLNEIDNQIMKSDSKEITSFLLQPIIDEIAEKKRAETFDAGIEESKKLYSRIRESSDFHLSLVLSHLQNYDN
ncbi:MAG: motility associated factor glycosyltransferase family protein, partial [Spirochaetales bacterium]|nr:motility associated factor glycosyltransferase family protein [Spirochaetales bacterium]